MSAENGHVVEKNPIGLPTDVVEQIVPELDRHLASLFVLFHQYQKHHWLVRGPQFRDLHLYLEEAYEEIHEQADVIAERMTVLGGLPTSGPVAQAETAYIEHEPEGEPAVRTMLEHDLQAEQVITQRFRASIRTAAELEDYGTEHMLKSMLFNIEDRAHHLDHYLERNTLTPGSREEEADE
jgi:DNA-binding ferritin-like protein